MPEPTVPHPQDEDALETFLDRLEDGPPPSATAQMVLEARYLLRNASGKVVETPEALFARVAGHVAAAEPEPAGRPRWAARFRRLMETRVFLPNSPTLMNAGLPGGQLAACFVLPVEDSIGEIFDAVRDMALVQQTGGGTGFSFSRLRPAGDRVSTTEGQSSGPLSFMEVFNAATDSIRQGGKRRGANMGVLEVAHPDVLRFITRKTDPARLTNFNLSVGLSAPFWEALEAGGTFALVNPRSAAVTGHLSAAKVLTLLARCAWATGEPGVLFLDRINEDNPTPALGQITSTNPCGELPLLPWESCNLGSLNLARFVRDGAIAWDGLAAATHVAIRLLDNVIDATRFPLPAVADATRATRKVGLGVMGFADLLVELGIPYGDDAALALADQVMGFVARESRRASEALARARGPFPAFAASRLAGGDGRPQRNATVNTIAPTGTLSILAGCSAGIEPLFAPAYRRRLLDGRETVEVHPLFAARLADGEGADPALLARVAAAGHARVPGVPEDLARLFVTAHEIPPAHHVAIQAAFQRHVDNSVSKTVNLPATASPEDVEAILRLARRLRCKGVTVYRDGSRQGQVLSAGPPPTAFNAPDAAPGRDQGDAGAPEGPGAAAGGKTTEVPCPDCGGPLEPAGPFRVCHRCAWSGF